MAIRIRRVDGVLVAVCAAETDARPGDHYIHDGEHYALAAKFAQDWKTGVKYPQEWAAAETQRLRDARRMITETTHAE